MVYQKFGSTVLRPFLEKIYEPMTTSEVKEKQYQFLVKEQIIEILEDLVMVTIYVVLLYLILLYNKDPMIYENKKEIQELVKGVHSRTATSKEIDSRQMIQEYLVNTFIFSVQSELWYGQYVYHNPGMTIDNSNKYIGVGRLRQHRSDNISCLVNKLMEFLNMTCKSDFLIGPEYRNFSENWGKVEDSDRFARMDNVWKYMTSSKSGTLPYEGKFAAYPGGGYISPLGRTIKNSLINSEYLFRNKWMDRYSRCVFIEILLYSPNSNLFNSVKIKFEMSPTGYIRPVYDVETARLLFIKEQSGILLLILLLSFMVVVVLLTIKIVYNLIRRKKIYFRDLMHFMDIVIIILSITCFFLYIERSKLVNTFLKKVEGTKRNEFINYFHLFYAEASFTILAALLVFTATFRLWKLLKFFIIIRIVEKTLKLSAAPVLCVFLWQLVILAYYSIAGMLFFGDYSHDFRDFEETLITLFNLSFGFADNFDFDILQTKLHFMYYSSFMILTTSIFAFYVAIITICYKDAQLCLSDINEYTASEYLKEKFWYYWKFIRIRLRGARLSGGEENRNEKLIYPKANEHRYADCLTINAKTMESMKLVSLHISRWLSRKDPNLSEADRLLVKKTIVHFLRKKEGPKEIFFIANLEGFKKKLFDNKVFLKMEKVASIFIKGNSKDYDLRKRMLEIQNERINKITNNLKLLTNVIEQIRLDET